MSMAALGMSGLVASGAGELKAGGAAEQGPDKDAIVIVHFGDSHCATAYLPKEQRVDALLNAKLAERYKDQKIVNINAGKDGERTRNLLDKRYASDVVGKIPRMDIALLRHRVMDTSVRPANYRECLDELINRLAKDYPGVQIVLETEFHTGGKHFRDDWNKQYAAYDVVTRALAAERKYPLVDISARRQKEIEAGNWDQCVRGYKPAMEKFGHRIFDGSKDEEMEGVKEWFGDTHPNPNGVRIAADEEFKVLTATWPAKLPRAVPPAGDGAAKKQSEKSAT